MNLVGKNLNTLLDLIFITLPFQQRLCRNKSAKSISYICYSYARLYLLFFFIGIMMYWKKLWCVCLLLKALEELKCNRYLKGPVCEQSGTCFRVRYKFLKNCPLNSRWTYYRWVNNSVVGLTHLWTFRTPHLGFMSSLFVV